MHRLIRISAALLILGLGACSDVAFNEEQNLGRRIMQFDPNDLETSSQNKVLFSRAPRSPRPGTTSASS